ncbi:MAG: imidazole glycerol phosphate synthase subunit HisH [Clostridiales bacterium]|jgi:glutamine amidotransferase|nr:imidazole glycerol phosphate synthase subunit HisH [Clostridiales bacterium]
MIAIIDYGVGNLFSLAGSLRHLGIESAVTRDLGVIRSAERVILPGVGAFGDAIAKFRAFGLEPALSAEVAKGKPLLGICLGMQLLFEKSFEFGLYEGLGYLKGEVHPLTPDIPADLKVPQIGWNSLRFERPDDPLLKYSKEGDYVYYVHSFYAKGCADSLVAWSEYGTRVPGLVHRGNVYGTQFHPEKSGAAGLAMLRAFAEVV